ncbi:MAG: hypothetical protein JXA03_01865 [Bacteroidales bacterium]|nr:hypothetical protein [Bacteroidales bacterium]
MKTRAIKKVLLYALLMLLTCRLSGQFNATLSLPDQLDQPTGNGYMPIQCDLINFPVYSIGFTITHEIPGMTILDVVDFHPNFPENEWTVVIVNHTVDLFWTTTNTPRQINSGETFCDIEYYFDHPECRAVTWVSASMFALPGLPFTLSLNNGAVCPPLPIYITWTGAVSADWFDPGNWDMGTVPATTNDVYIPYNVPIIPSISGGTAVTGSLTIQGGGMLIVLPSGSLTTYGVFSNDGTFLIDSDIFGYSGSYINLGDVTGCGTFQFNRTITTTAGYGDVAGWHYISSPVQNFSSLNINDYWLNTWSEPDGQWQHHEGSDDWTPVPEMFLGGLKAWSVKLDTGYGCYNGPTGQTIEFISDMYNVGSEPFSETCTYTAGAGYYTGWNLIGNPYPCSIDPFAIVWDFNMNQSIYFWDSQSLTYQTWAGGVGPNIPPTQGFFVESLDNSTFTLSGNERVHQGAFFFDEGIDNLLILEASGNGYTDKAYVHFNKNASQGFDKNLDARKIISPAAIVPQIYTVSGTEKYAINSVNGLTSIPLCFESGTSGEYTIKMLEKTNLDGVVLEDILKGARCDILSTQYTFIYQAGDEPQRFSLHFAKINQ